MGYSSEGERLCRNGGGGGQIEEGEEVEGSDEIRSTITIGTRTKWGGAVKEEGEKG